jgi:hypothetical protein
MFGLQSASREATTVINDPGRLTDAQARNLVIRALRLARKAYRAADTAGEREERELDRLIKRKTRINASSLVTVANRYQQYQKLVNNVQLPLTDAMNVASQF